VQHAAQTLPPPPGPGEEESRGPEKGSSVGSSSIKLVAPGHDVIVLVLDGVFDGAVPSISRHRAVHFYVLPRPGPVRLSAVLEVDGFKPVQFPVDIVDLMGQVARFQIGLEYAVVDLLVVLVKIAVVLLLQLPTGVIDPPELCGRFALLLFLGSLGGHSLEIHPLEIAIFCRLHQDP